MFIYCSQRVEAKITGKKVTPEVASKYIFGHPNKPSLRQNF